MPRNHKPKKPIKPMKLDISDEMIAERRGGSAPMPKSMPKWMASSITKIDFDTDNSWFLYCLMTTLLIIYYAFLGKSFKRVTL